MKKTNTPEELTPESRDFVDAIVKDFGIADKAGLELLRQAGLCLDRISQARAVLAVEGLQVFDRFEQCKAHPLLKVECDARNGFLSAMRVLALDGTGEPNGGGRNA